VSAVKGWWRDHPAVRFAAYALLVLLVLAAFVVAYQWSPWWIDGARLRKLSPKDETAALATDRDEVLKIVAGLAGAVAVVYTVRRHGIDRRTLEATQRSVAITQERDAETARLTTEAQVTDRYIKAIGLLASERPEERLGGIYALERLMADSPRDQPTIVEVLAAFVRRTSHAPRTPPATVTERTPDADVTAAVTVLARRPQEETPHVIDLRRTDLAGLELGSPASRYGRPHPHLAMADLRGADLTGADLSRTTLAGADLTGADLTRARFRFSSLKDASLGEATLVDAYLGRADLSGAQLRKADLTRADLFRSNLERAAFDDANLTGAQLTRANLARASLRGADLTGADLMDAGLAFVDLGGADLTGVTLVQNAVRLSGWADGPLPGVHLDGADLTDAHVTAAQLAGAYLTDQTRLPGGLTGDPWVRARLADCRQWREELQARGRSVPGDLEGLAPTPEPAAT
jgi:uncharacterized protein YjbI with pentapeptide repeats